MMTPVTVDLSLVVLNPETKFTESIKLTTALTVNEKFDTFVLSHGDLQTTTEGENVPGKSLTAMLTVLMPRWTRPNKRLKCPGYSLSRTM